MKIIHRLIQWLVREPRRPQFDVARALAYRSWRERQIEEVLWNRGVGF